MSYGDVLLLSFAQHTDMICYGRIFSKMLSPDKANGMCLGKQNSPLNSVDSVLGISYIH